MSELGWNQVIRIKINLYNKSPKITLQSKSVLIKRPLQPTEISLLNDNKKSNL
jgi:hypothetical protein